MSKALTCFNAHHGPMRSAVMDVCSANFLGSCQDNRMSSREWLNVRPKMPPTTWHSPSVLTMVYDPVLGLVDPEGYLGHDLHYSSS